MHTVPFRYLRRQRPVPALFPLASGGSEEAGASLIDAFVGEFGRIRNRKRRP
jgi:hypothetical protein